MEMSESAAARFPGEVYCPVAKQACLRASIRVNTAEKLRKLGGVDYPVQPMCGTGKLIVDGAEYPVNDRCRHALAALQKHAQTFNRSTRIVPDGLHALTLRELDGDEEITRIEKGKRVDGMKLVSNC